MDATIIKAPSSTKNKATEPEPEMHLTKTNIGADARTGLARSVKTTASNEHDQADRLEQCFFPIQVIEVSISGRALKTKQLISTLQSARRKSGLSRNTPESTKFQSTPNRWSPVFEARLITRFSDHQIPVRVHHFLKL